MQPISNDDLRKAFRMTAFIGLAMIASLIIYTVMVELIKQQNATFKGFSPMPDDVLTMLRYALLAVAAVEFFAIRFLNTLMLSGKVPIRSSDATNGFAPGVQRLVTSSIVTYALCESVAIYGLVLFFIQGNSGDFYLFLILSLLCFSIYFPRYGTWAEWLAEQERGQAGRRQQ
jgi:F0F1-type ATP synthase membrane subunit c/vacuolar-type H+-ATPase subunit K